MMQFYIIKTETLKIGYENAPSLSFIAWDKNGKPIRENMAKAYRYFTIEEVKEAIKRGNINKEKWKPYLLTMDANEVVV